ncbi:hypothetical protein ACFL5L_00560 [candidate division KSB1 bacterium]
MCEKSSGNHRENGILYSHGALKAARFVGIAAGIPIGMVQDIRSGLEKVFNPIVMRYKSRQRINQLEKRLAELENSIKNLNLPIDEELIKIANQAGALNVFTIPDNERRVLRTIFRHNLKLQKPRPIVK